MIPTLDPDPEPRELGRRQLECQDGAGGHAAEFPVVPVELGARMAGLVADRNPSRPVGIPESGEADPPHGRVLGRPWVAGQRGESVGPQRRSIRAAMITGT